MSRCWGWLTLALALSTSLWHDAHGADRPVVGRQGMVVSVSPAASDVGAAVLKQGGNAVDAAVATALALAVTWPEAGNIGGGGFMMVWPGETHAESGKPVCIDYRETAPAAAKPDMFVNDPRQHTHKIVGTPGTLRGLELAHQKYGKLPWKELVTPAVKLAREGLVVDAALADSLNSVLKTSPAAEFPEMVRVFKAPGSMWKAGDKLMQPELAATLERIAQEGPAAFYQGAVAEQIVAEMQAGGGLITKADLAAYKAVARTPIHGTYRGYDIYGPPPPSSGGTCLVEMLNILENFDLPRLAKSRDAGAKDAGAWPPEVAHLVAEAMRRAYRDRAAHLGDPDFTAIPPHLITKEYAKKLAAGIDLKRATASASLAGEIELAKESESTTHFSVVDSSGMAVSNTYTLEHSFGARVVVRGAGFLLNNEMGDFNRRPGHTDTKGAVGTPPNLVAPGKRMLSSQTPTLVARDGKLLLVTGSPGGRTIINTVLCTLVQRLDLGADVQQAVDAPRLHQQWFPDLLRFEGFSDPAYGPLVKALEGLGHRVDPKSGKQGDCHTIEVVRTATGTTLIGAADRRRGGKAAGY